MLVYNTVWSHSTPQTLQPFLLSPPLPGSPPSTQFLLFLTHWVWVYLGTNMGMERTGYPGCTTEDNDFLFPSSCQLVVAPLGGTGLQEPFPHPWLNIDRVQSCVGPMQVTQLLEWCVQWPMLVQRTVLCVLLPPSGSHVFSCTIFWDVPWTSESVMETCLRGLSTQQSLLGTLNPCLITAHCERSFPDQNWGRVSPQVETQLFL